MKTKTIDIIQRTVLYTSLIAVLVSLSLNFYWMYKGEKQAELNRISYEQGKQEREQAMQESFNKMLDDIIYDMAYQDAVLKDDYKVEREAYQIARTSDEYKDWQDSRIAVLGKTCDKNFDYFLEIEDNVHVNLVNYTKQYLSFIDEDILKALSDTGWRMVLTNDVLKCDNVLDDNTRIFGYTDPNVKEIRIHADERAINYSVIHEVGHAVVFYLQDSLDKAGYTSWNSNNMTRLYLHGDEMVQRRYIYEITSEVYAQTFVDYTLYPLELKAQDSKLYTIYDNAVGKIKAASVEE